jgi:glycosyltransferase involved in cell wall biosynthesis
MRIGIDARFYGPIGKGLGRYTEKLIEHLERIDTKNEYVIFLRRENFSSYEPANPRFSKAIADYQWYSFSEQLLFPFFLRRFRLDLVHFPHFNVPLLYRGKFVVTIHDLILLRYPTLRNTTRMAAFYWAKFAAYRLVIASAVRRAAHIITVSHFAEHDIIERYPAAAGKISVTYEAADPLCRFLTCEASAQLLRRLGLLSSGGSRDILQTCFLYVGNAYPHKHLGLLLDTAERMPEERFVLVGKEDHFYAGLREDAKRRGLSNVVFAGFLTDQELSVLYRSAVAYVFPSLYEGFGLPPLEAMTFGLPVVSSDRASLPEILGSAAAYFNPEKPGDLERILRRILGDEEERKRLSESGYERVAGFRWSEMAEETLRIYEKTTKQKQTA